VPRNYSPSLLALGALLLAACQDSPSASGPPPPPPGGKPGPTVTLEAVECTADRGALTIQCAAPTPSINAASDVIIGGQHTFVNVTATGISYNAGSEQFTFSVRLQSLIEQDMGTTDGINPDVAGIRIFFHEGPTVTGGTGAITVVGDGSDAFTAANQPFYRYSTILSSNETSAPKLWTLTMPPTVTTFTFRLYISAPVQFPNGYVTINGQLPGYDAGEYHPGDVMGLVTVSKTAAGTPVPSMTYNFSSTDALCASVSGGGAMTAVRAGNCEIHANDGSRDGHYTLDVSGTKRVWTGAASTDWSAAGNWSGNLVPASVDTAIIPLAVPNFPALTANTGIGGLDVADGASVSLGAFNLTAVSDVLTGSTAGSGILGTTGRLILAGVGKVGGRVPGLLVTGTYQAQENIHAVGLIETSSGLLECTSDDVYELEVDA
jgi:hypothetical protein